VNQLAAARSARRDQDWQACHDATTAQGAVFDDPLLEAEALDLRAEAAWWLGRLDDCVEARERAYVLYDGAGDDRRAGMCAVWLYEHHCFRAHPAIAGGWLRRARRALGEGEDCAELGALLLREAEVAHGSGDLEQAALLAERCVALGRRLRAPDLEAEALQTQGRVLIDQGQPKEGLALLDEAMLFALEDRLSPYSTGKVYCSLISACEHLGDFQRAAEWTDATARWASRHPLAVFPGLCRVHHATALQWRGRWAEAEQEAARACEELTMHVPNAAAAWAEIGDIRRRLGDLDAAEAAFRRADELCGQPRAGLALLRLAQGRVPVATKMIDAALGAAGGNRLARAKLLPAAAQIAIAAGDHDGAAAAVRELTAIADDYASPTMTAAATTALGRLQLAHGHPEAGSTLREAVTRWLQLEVPYESATARVLLGQACRATGDDEGAATAFAAALGLFDELGASLDATQLRSLSRAAELPGGLTAREVQVLRYVAAGKTNKQIATQLGLSDKTIGRHLSNIFVKIDVGTRSAATAYAFEHHLVERQTTEL
jgi:ATP/maltotriose-dependent transcriptional regulator MalT